MISKLSSIHLMNRFDCCGDHLRDVEVRAGMLPVSGKGRITINDICGKFVGPGEEGGKYTIDCVHELWADYIKAYHI